MSLFGGLFGPGFQKQFDEVLARVGDDPHEVVRQFFAQVLQHHQFLSSNVWDMHKICQEHFKRHPDSQSITFHAAAIGSRYNFRGQETCIRSWNGRGSPWVNRMVPYRPIRGKTESLFLFEKRISPDGMQVAYVPLYDDKTPLVDHRFDVLPTWD